jgi:uncharacterized glyoxalase superfamily protein PhnB
VLIDWERAGPGREFEIRVPDVIAARTFYKAVLGARETSRQETPGGEAVRLGLAIGRVQFTVTSEPSGPEDRPLLTLLAADLGVPYIAILLHVEDPDRMAYRAEQNGATVSAPHESGEITIVTDPFGSHWVLKKREPAAGTVVSLSGLQHRSKTRH